MTNKILIIANVKANIVGVRKKSSSELLFVRNQTENVDPRIGPIINPIENAIPINAIPFPLFDSEETSVTIDGLKLIFALLKPPTVRDIRNNAKLLFDNIHNRYEHDIPIKLNIIA